MSNLSTSNNPMEELLKRLINDPSLMKTIEKMATESVKMGLKERKKQREQERFGTFDYLNQVEKSCRLCSLVTISYQPMVWDKVEKLHRTGGMFREILPIFSSLEVRRLIIHSSTCECCSTALMSVPKEILISKLIGLANRVL